MHINFKKKINRSTFLPVYIFPGVYEYHQVFSFAYKSKENPVLFQPIEMLASLGFHRQFFEHETATSLLIINKI